MYPEVRKRGLYGGVWRVCEQIEHRRVISVQVKCIDIAQRQRRGKLREPFPQRRNKRGAPMPE